MDYLTEAKLGEELKIIFPNYEFIHNKKFHGFFPDYRCDELMLIVEFDGYRHYQNSLTIVRDAVKDFLYENDMGYKVVRIPYFIQLSQETIKFFFGVDLEYTQTYPHGFIDPKALLPADFCSIGLYKFYNNLICMDNVKDCILDSMLIICQNNNMPDMVVPWQWILTYGYDYWFIKEIISDEYILRKERKKKLDDIDLDLIISKNP